MNCDHGINCIPEEIDAKQKKEEWTCKAKGQAIVIHLWRFSLDWSSRVKEEDWRSKKKHDFHIEEQEWRTLDLMGGTFFLENQQDASDGINWTEVKDEQE